MGVHAAGVGACLYDSQCHPFLWLRDGTHPLAAGPVNPGLLPRPGRSDRQRRWVPQSRLEAGRRARGELQLRHAEVYADLPCRHPDDAAVLADRWKFCVTGIGV
jgi:hypothetical protein